jgi:hypothetical protein
MPFFSSLSYDAISLKITAPGLKEHSLHYRTLFQSLGGSLLSYPDQPVALQEVHMEPQLYSTIMPDKPSLQNLSTSCSSRILVDVHKSLIEYGKSVEYKVDFTCRD